MPRIAFFDYPDVFEDFYPHYGVDQQAFATTWAATGNHALVRLIQRELADVTWFELSLAPTVGADVHHVTGARVVFVRSSAAHRLLWRAFYLAPGAWRWQQRAFPAFELAASYLAPLSRGLLRALRADPPDLIFGQDYASGRFDVLLALGRALGVPVVAYHSGSAPERYVGRLAKRITVRRADRLLVTSEAERRMLVEGFGASPERVAVMLTPIDTERFRPSAARRREVLYLGRLDDRVKRVSRLIRAFAEVASDAELVIAGTGRDEQRLRRLASGLAPERVRFLGWVSETSALLASAHCLVLPSIMEGFPTVVGEALASGTPVIGTAVGAIPELVVPGRTGWLVPPEDHRALVDALGEALSSDLEPMRAEARRVAEARLAPAAVAAELRRLLPL
jgi:glycosyltransferase involved in cell wall biosynthesis